MDHIPTYSTLADAKIGCGKDDECTCIADYECDGISWSANKGTAITSYSGSCAWTKSNILCSFAHTYLVLALMEKLYVYSL